MKNSQTRRTRRLAAALFLTGAVVATGAGVRAANTSDFSLSITAGTLTTDIRDASRVSVGSPSVAFSSWPVGFDCRTGGSASTGTLGTNTQRVYVDNPDASDTGWTLGLAATAGATAKWTGASNHIDYNDDATSGCTDNADTDSYKGQLTIDPSVGTITTDCQSCNTTGIAKGSSTAYLEGTTSSVTLLNAGSTSSDVGRWYFTGVSGSQTIPAEQPIDTYTLPMTLTATAQ